MFFRFVIIVVAINMVFARNIQPRDVNPKEGSKKEQSLPVVVEQQKSVDTPVLPDTINNNMDSDSDSDSIIKVSLEKNANGVVKASVILTPDGKLKIVENDSVSSSASEKNINVEKPGKARRSPTGCCG